MSSILNRIANYQHSLSTKQNNFRSIVGLIQFCATSDVNKNFETCSRLIEECAEKGAQMVCLPEHFAYMTNETISSGGKTYDFNDKLDHRLFQKYRQLALDN
mmetsp:Transcript_32859/g.40620  ORF Transcript_32859/g.40620 Transcript_32859/m.40620 type:complete len:102 (+) Transcript_32859:40-345(+)